jgi:hypothetical protein
MKLKSIFISFLVISCLFTISISAQTTINEEVTALIKKKRKFNKEKGYGFRIQLYYGLVETNAKIELQKFKLEFPFIKTHIDFINPEWKSSVGDYKTRLMADKILNDIKLKFPSAIVVPR